MINEQIRANINNEKRSLSQYPTFLSSALPEILIHKFAKFRHPADNTKGNTDILSLCAVGAHNGQKKKKKKKRRIFWGSRALK